MIFIIIPVFNRWKYTEACILSLQEQIYSDFKIIVIDHGSKDGTSSNIEKQFPNIILIKGNESMWWTAATNLGLIYSLENKADYVLLLNNDLIVNENYLSSLYNVLIMNQPCVVGSVSVDIHNFKNVDFCGLKWNKYTAKIKNLADDYSTIDLLNSQSSNEFIETDMLPGRGVLIPISLVTNLGLMDESKFPHYGADLDYSLKIKNIGYSLLVSKEAIVKSHIKETGIPIRDNGNLNIKKIIKIFFSIKSPNNIRTRYYFALNHSPISVIHFFLDIGRIMFSLLLK